MIRTAESIAVDPDADFSPISVDEEFAPIPEDEFNAPPEDYVAPDPGTIDGGGSLIPLESNGFDFLDAATASLPIAIIVTLMAFLVALIGATFLIHNYEAGSRGRKVISAILLCTFATFIVLSSVTIAFKATDNPASSSAAQFASWAGTTYKVDLTEAQAERLLDGGNAAVDYAGNRVEVRAVLASDDKLYLVDASGRELPDNPAYYFAPTPDLIPGK